MNNGRKNGGGAISDEILRSWSRMLRGRVRGGGGKAISMGRWHRNKGNKCSKRSQSRKV